MPFVTILPNEKLCPQGAKIEVKTGEKLAQSLNKAGINLPHACEYNCACATCHVIVKEGLRASVSPPTTSTISSTTPSAPQANRGLPARP